MKLKKCQFQMHFYDSDRYDSCPQCAKLKDAQRIPADSTNPTLRLSDLIQESPDVAGKPPVPPTATTMRPNTEPESVVAQPQPPQLQQEQPFQQQFPAPLPPVSAFPDAAHDILENNIEVASNEKTKTKLSIFQKELHKSSAVSRTESLRVTGGDKTIAYYQTENSVEPVVGWLVCIKGSHIGESFSLKAGQNFIGRALDMDVRLTNDQAVSRIYHAGVTFDPQTERFYAVPGHSAGLLHINGQLAVEAVELHAYDVMELGASGLMLIPLCGESFRWSNYLK